MVNIIIAYIACVGIVLSVFLITVSNNTGVFMYEPEVGIKCFVYYEDKSNKAIHCVKS